MPPAELLGLMRGTAPVSAGASAELERLIAAFETDARARELLASDDDPGQVLAALRALDGEAGEAVSGYLDLVGYRLLDGFDISEPYALEMPDALVRAIRIAVAGRDLEGADVETAVADIRGKVPEQHRAEFDELLGEARLTYRLRDERGVFSDIWASGLMRRAVLEAGAASQSEGGSTKPVHLIDAGLRRDVLAGRGRGWSLGRRAGGPRHGAHYARPEGGAAVAGRPAATAAGRLRPAARRRPG